MIITAYLDESGTHAAAPVTVVGAVMGNPRQWERFERQFDVIRRDFGFRVFHTKKFKRRAGDFKGWRPEKCLALGLALADLTDDAFMAGATMTVDNRDYDAQFRAGKLPRKLRLPTKYGLCVGECVFHFALEAAKKGLRGRLPVLNFVCETGAENAGDGKRVFDEIKETLAGSHLDVLGAMSFAPKDSCPGLMMADFVAHSQYAHETGSPHRRAIHAERRAILAQSHIPRQHTFITRLSFKPGGLQRRREDLIAELRARKSRT